MLSYREMDLLEDKNAWERPPLRAARTVRSNEVMWTLVAGLLCMALGGWLVAVSHFTSL